MAAARKRSAGNLAALHTEVHAGDPRTAGGIAPGQGLAEATARAGDQDSPLLRHAKTPVFAMLGFGA